MKFLSIFGIILLLGHVVKSANILCLMAVPSPSHHIWNSALVLGLAAKGHNMTFVSSDQVKQPINNVHVIHLENTYNMLYNSSDTLNLLEMANSNLITGVFDFMEYMMLSCRGMLSSRGLQQLLDYPDNFKFDLVITDYTIGPCLLYFVHKFNNPPLLSVTAFVNPPYTAYISGGHSYPSYIPHYALSYTTKMNFMQRLLNTAMYAFDIGYRQYIGLPKLDKLARERFGDVFPYLGDIEKQTALVFVNANPATDYPESIPPNIIRVGGLQIANPKPLPQGMLDFIESSDKGTVLCSLGTNVRSDMLDPETQKIFIQAFAQMPQYNFLWKFESDSLPMKLPTNVMVRAWLPQNDVLSHPKIVAFISHSGWLSTQEALWYGKPVIAIPFFADQHRNSFHLKSSGVGEIIKIQTVTLEVFRSTVLKVLENPSYAEKMKVISKSFRNQQVKPLDSAVWWTEWLIENPNATFLLSPTQDLGFLAANGYDIILFGFAIIVVIIHTFSKLVCRTKPKKTIVDSKFSKKNK